MQNSLTYQSDYLIIGAGLIGSSVAMHLSQMLQGKEKNILVVDLDLEGTFSSSELNAGGARATWDQSVNIDLAKESIHFLSQNTEISSFRECGYLWLYNKESWENAKKRADRIRNLGWSIDLLSINELQERAPFIDQIGDLGGATFSPKDGLFNPNLLKNYFRSEAKKSGVHFLDGCKVVSSLEDKGYCIVEGIIFPIEENLVKDLLSGKSENHHRMLSKVEIKAEVVINCGGAWANSIANVLHYPCPSKAIRRQVSVFSSKDISLQNNGMIVDTSGVYFHPEANNILAGYADLQEPIGYNLDYDGVSFFEEKIWMPLFHRSSKFESLRHLTGWGGLYEVSPDYSGIMGKAISGKNIFECHSFSGRGAMQSYAAGRGLAELIAFGKYQSIDLSSLSAERFINGKLVPEGLHI